MFRFTRKPSSGSHRQFVHSVFCLTTGPKPPPKRCLHIVRSRAPSFKWEYPLLSLRSSSSFLRLLPLLIVTSISPFIFPSITCFRQYLVKITHLVQSRYVELVQDVFSVMTAYCDLWGVCTVHCVRVYCLPWHSARYTRLTCHSMRP